MTFNYKCDQCGYVLEMDYSLAAEKPESFACICGGTFKRIYEAPAIKFKGSGFYTNDQWSIDEDADDQG